MAAAHTFASRWAPLAAAACLALASGCGGDTGATVDAGAEDAESDASSGNDSGATSDASNEDSGNQDAGETTTSLLERPPEGLERPPEGNGLPSSLKPPR